MKSKDDMFKEILMSAHSNAQERIEKALSGADPDFLRRVLHELRESGEEYRKAAEEIEMRLKNLEREDAE